MVEVNGAGEPLVRAPIAFRGQVSEAQLESWLINQPELSGEPLLVLGSQLAEFAEDKDRLDVLAVDESGELVLVELKVDDSFRVTDLQALAYAGAYASMPTAHFAEVLRKHSSRLGDPSASLETAKTVIAEFVELDDFEDWQPSRRVRIKLLAPGFPKRVLKTVKWLGDVYEMPIEAIEVKLFADSTGSYHLTIERLLPVPGDDAFDMTVRETEKRRQSQNITRRPAVLNSLLANGDLADGQTLWLRLAAIERQLREAHRPDDPLLKVTLDASGGSPRFRWRPTPSAHEQELPPAAAWHAIVDTMAPGRYVKRYRPVHSLYSVQPDGETLGELAQRTGAWDAEAPSD
jgi:hypothetical protein